MFFMDSNSYGMAPRSSGVDAVHVGTPMQRFFLRQTRAWHELSNDAHSHHDRTAHFLDILSRYMGPKD